MTKGEIRADIKRIKETLTPLDISRCSRPVTEKVINSDDFQKTDVILTYMEYNQELITHAIMTKAWEMGKRVAVPKVINKVMEFYYIESFDDVYKGYMGILEPYKLEKASDEKALVIVPGLAFDLRFNRIGYGGGFYDDFFERYSDRNYIKMGLAYDFQIIDKIPCEEHDKKVDMLITPKAFYSSGVTFR